PARRRAPALAVLAAIAAVAAAAGVAASRLGRAPAADNRDFLLPSPNPSAMVWTPQGLWTADWADGSVTLFDAGLTPVRTVKLPNTHPAGLAVTKDYLYLSDAWSKTIEKRLLDRQLTLVDSQPSPGPSPSGLFADGPYLWSADSQQGKIYRHKLEDLRSAVSYPAPGPAPAAVCVEDGSLWSADAQTRKIYRHAATPDLPVTEVYSLPALTVGDEPLSAFTLHDFHFWLARDGKALLMKRHPGAFQVEKR
ncbi:MAG: hypothetical protein ABIF82_13555, partial [Planctomycetota bacterium]